MVCYFVAWADAGAMAMVRKWCVYCYRSEITTVVVVDMTAVVVAMVILCGGRHTNVAAAAPNCVRFTGKRSSDSAQRTHAYLRHASTTMPFSGGDGNDNCKWLFLAQIPYCLYMPKWGEQDAHAHAIMRLRVVLRSVVKWMVFNWHVAEYFLARMQHKTCKNNDKTTRRFNCSAALQHVYVHFCLRMFGRSSINLRFVTAYAATCARAL